MIKPDYNQWEGKEQYEIRFLKIGLHSPHLSETKIEQKVFFLRQQPTKNSRCL